MALLVTAPYAYFSANRFHPLSLPENPCRHVLQPYPHFPNFTRSLVGEGGFTLAAGGSYDSGSPFTRVVCAMPQPIRIEYIYK
jgi:hypothetical protein